MGRSDLTLCRDDGAGKGHPLRTRLSFFSSPFVPFWLGGCLTEAVLRLSSLNCTKAFASAFIQNSAC